MSDPCFLAVDWGTTNLRAWVVGRDGAALDGRDFPLGVSRLQPGEAPRRFAETVRPALKAERLPALMCGMVGSNLGWREVPYLDCPADLRALAANLCRLAGEDPPTMIVPGLRARRADGTPDVMRGEEVQVLGWAAGKPERRRGRRLVCHPGTHAKWVRVVEGRVDHFVTAMTGELFDLLCKYSVLQVRESPDDPDAFDEGLEAAGDGAALAARLFTARARVVGGDMPAERVRPYLSGLLIGAEVAATPALVGAEAGEPVALIGDLRLCGLYRRALEARGIAASVHDGDEAVLVGLKALFETEFVS